MATFGNLNVHIADSSAPSAPASGLILYSATGGVLSVVNNTGTVQAVGFPSAPEGAVLMGSGTNYSYVSIGTNTQVLISNGTTLGWANV